MKNRDFEKWLTHEETCLKVSKELDDWCENDVFVDELYRRYRQLEKDNALLRKSKDELFGQMTEESDRADKAEESHAELLAALKPFAEYEGMVELSLKDNLKEYDKCCKAAHKVFDKHKGE